MSIGPITLPRTLTAQESWQRTIITQDRELPAVRLMEYDRDRETIGFRITTENQAIGFLWIQNLYARRGSHADVDMIMLGSSPTFPVLPRDHIYEKYHGKGYGLAAYLIGIEHLAEEGRALRNGSKMTTHSISLWQRLVRYGVADCRQEPRLCQRSKDGYPDYYKAKYVTRLKQERT